MHQWHPCAYSSPIISAVLGMGTFQIEVWQLQIIMVHGYAVHNNLTGDQVYEFKSRPLWQIQQSLEIVQKVDTHAVCAQTIAKDQNKILIVYPTFYMSGHKSSPDRSMDGWMEIFVTE